MGRYFKLKNKVSMVVRPILPKGFILNDVELTWNDIDAVYDAGVIEYSEDKEAWKVLTEFAPDQESAKPHKDITEYRMRVKYNMHWSTYLRAKVFKSVEEPKEVKKPVEDPKLRATVEDYKIKSKKKK